MQTLDFAFRLPARTTDRIYITNRPKAFAAFVAPEGFVSYRFANSWLEGRAEMRVGARRTNVAKSLDRDQAIGEFEFGPRFGAASLVLDWQPSYYYLAHTSRKLLELQEVGLKFKLVTPLAITGYNAVAFFIEASSINAAPSVYSRKRLSGEAQWTVRSGANVRTTWTPEFSIAHYDNYFGKRRTDASLGLRWMQRREFGSGWSIALSLYGYGIASTNSQKSGLDFEVRPELRFRM